MNFTFKHTRLACYGAYATSAIASNFPPILFIIFKRDLGLSLGALGTLISLNFGVQMITDIISSQFVDKIGYRKSAVFANVLVAIGIILMGVLPSVFSNRFFALIIATMTYAIGSGLLEVLISPIMEAIPSEEKSANMSILHSFYCWGQLLAVFLTTLFIIFFGGSNWYLLCFFWAIVPIVTALLYTRVPINQLPMEEDKSSFAIFKNKLFWSFLILMTASGASEIAISQWASFFVETSLGVSKTLGDLLGPCMFAFLMGVARLIYAKLSSKVNLANYIIFCGSLCVVGYLLMVFVPNNYISLSAIGIIGFSVAVMWPGTLSLASRHFPFGGTAMFAYLAIFGDIGCTSGPAIAAATAEVVSVNNSSLRGGLAICTVFPVLVVVMTIIIKRMGTNINE